MTRPDLAVELVHEAVTASVSSDVSRAVDLLLRAAASMEAAGKFGSATEAKAMARRWEIKAELDRSGAFRW